MSQWLKRLSGTILSGSNPVVLQGDIEWGSYRIIASLRSREQPLIWVDFDSIPDINERQVGNLLSVAVREGLGAPLFGGGLDGTYAVSVLAQFISLLQPLTLAITRGDRASDFVNQLASVFAPPNKVIVQASRTEEFGSWYQSAVRVGTAEMAIRLEEAIHAYGTEHSRSDIARALELVGGAIGPLERMLGLVSSSISTWPLTALGVGDTRLDHGAVIDALVSRSRWLDAFELAVWATPSRIPEIVEEAGNAAFDNGEFDRFWRSISTIPGWVSQDDRVQYWRFNAAVAVNKWRPLLKAVDRYLEGSDAPDLRALRATVEVTSDSLEAAERAVRAQRSVGTLSAVGFLYSLNGDVDRAITILIEAVELAERHGRHRLAIQAASNLSLAYVSGGRYIRARYWAGWSLRRLMANGIQDELLRLSVANMAAYSRLLTDSVASAEQVLATVVVDDDIVGIPSIEGIISTLGDLQIVRGRPEEAIEQYRRNAGLYQRKWLPVVANDLVRAYVLLGDVQTAVSIAEEAFEVGASGSKFECHVAEVALGAALVEARDPRAEDLLENALSYFLANRFSTYGAQSAIQLACLMVIGGRMSEAMAILTRAAPLLDELGDSGWRLLGGNRPEVAILKTMYGNGEPKVEFHFLGDQCIRIKDSVEPLSRRMAELFAILAYHPAGLRSEELALELYGDGANSGTLKAAISRARRYVPIVPLPYRLSISYRADFIEVLELLGSNRVHAALELYRGPLLPASEAPGIVRLREYLEEAMRQAVLASQDSDVIIDFANQLGDDLELWEEAHRSTNTNDPRRPLVNARIRRIRREWNG